jgi:hypothetical protein
VVFVSTTILSVAGLTNVAAYWFDCISKDENPRFRRLFLREARTMKEV